MEYEFSITRLMIKDHSKLLDLLNNLEEKSKENFISVKKAFLKFKWELEKHIFIEEKAIFTDYNPIDITEGYKMLPEITKQHNYMINILNNWEKDVRKNHQLTDIYSFKQFLINHRIYEERKVYPKLDASLNDEQKKQIVEKITEII